MSKLFFRSLTGSRLYGLNDENSDYDWKHIIVSPLTKVISPFTKDSSSVSQVGNNDTCTYELRHFVHLLSKCNPTILEILFAKNAEAENDVRSIFYKELQFYKAHFLEATRVYYAHSGYAHDQRKLFQDTTLDSKRVSKAAVAFIRIMEQGVTLLSTGGFHPTISDQALKDELLELKYEYNPNKHNNLVLKRMEELEIKLAEAYQKSCLPRANDASWETQYSTSVAWAEDYLVRVYKELG